MSNDLVKTTNVSFIPGKPGIPADPGQQYSPPYWWDFRYLTYRYVPFTAYTDQLVSSGGGSVALNPGDEFVFVPSGYDSSGTLTYTPYVRTQVLVIEKRLAPAKPYIAPTPAVDPVPAQTLYDFNIGWNSGARSIVTDSGAGTYTFSVPAGVAGAVVGLAHADADGGLGGMSHAIYFGNGVAYAMEYGRIKATLGANTGQQWALRRLWGEVEVLMGGVSVHAFLSPLVGEVFLDTSLYVGGDRIVSPSYAASGDGAAALPAVTGLAGDYATYSLGGGGLRGLSGSARGVSFFLSDGASGEFTFTIPGGTSGAGAGLVPTGASGGVEDMTHGVYASGDVVYAVEEGRIVAVVGGNSGQEWGIIREGTTVSVVADGEVVYEFTSPSYGDVYLDTTLTSGGVVGGADVTELGGVSGVAFTPWGAGECVLPSISGLAGSASTYAMGGGVLQPFETSGRLVAWALTGDGGFAVTVPPTVTGEYVGLTPTPGGTPSGIDHGIYFTDGNAYAVENGVIVGDLGANTGQEWVIRRDDTQVSVVVDGEVVYVSPTESTGVVSLDSTTPAAAIGGLTPAQLYSGGGTAVLAGVAGLAGSYATYSIGGGAMLGLSTSGASSAGVSVVTTPTYPGVERYVTLGGGMATLGGLQALGGATQYAGGTATLPRMVGEAEDGGTPTPAVGVGGGFLNFMTATSVSVVGEVGDGDGEMASLQGIGADADYSGGTQTLGYLFSIAGGETNGLLNLRFVGAAQASMEDVSAVILSLLFQAQVATSLSSAKLHVAEVTAGGQVSTSITATAEYLLELLFQAMGVTPLEDPNAAAFAWACAQDGGRVSRYEGYGFQSFAKIGGRYYGVRTDGVYLLEGETDDGEAIAATAHFGKLNFNSPAIKTVPNVYVGVGAQETLFLRVETRQGTFLYRARRASASMQTQRFDLGRGLRDNWFDFVLVSPNCSGFDLDNIEFIPVMSKRRI